MPATGADLPLVSIVIPAHDSADTIGATLTGALTQTYPHLDIVVVDDGSTDATADICRAYGDRVRVVSQSNGGSASARNHGIRISRGPLVAFCDADDILLPPYVERAVGLFRRQPARTWVTCDALMLTKTGVSPDRRVLLNGTPTGWQQRLGALRQNFVSVLSVCPRPMLEELHGFDETLRYREDWDLWLRALFSGWRVAFQLDPSALYRVHAGAKSAHAAGFDAEDEILRRVQARFGAGFSPEERAYLAARLRASSPRRLLLQGEEALRREDVTGAREALTAAGRLGSGGWRLRVKAETMRVPAAARWWRRRLAHHDDTVGNSAFTRTGAHP